jgi:tetratricopeptide (TPR) repeat protein
MVLLSVRQSVVAEELAEWREDVAGGIGPKIVLLSVPPGWGRSTVLDQLAEDSWPRDGNPVTCIFRIEGKQLSGGPGQQAADVRARLADACARHPVARALGLDRPQGVAMLSLGAGSLFMSGLGVLLGMLAAQEIVTAAGSVRDAGQGGQVGMLARAARSAAQLSAKVPVVVLIDDADRLDLGMALVLLENLMFREGGKMLIVAATTPGGELAGELLAGGRAWIARRVFAVDGDPDMGMPSRTAMARELLPGLDDGLARRIGQRTATFADVYKVASADRIAELGPAADPAVARAVIDTAIDVVMHRPEPSQAAVVLAWAGGTIHSRQLARALAVTGQAPPPADRDPDLLGEDHQTVVRLTDMESPRLRRAAVRLESRSDMAAAVLEEALAVGADPAEPLVERIVAGGAVHRVRSDLAEPDLARLLRVQRDLVANLEAVGELADAAEVADEALAGCPADDAYASDRAELGTALLRLSRAPSPGRDELVRELTEEAVAGGAAVGLEARVWAAISLLGIPHRREEAGRLVEQLAGELDSHGDLGPQATNWRLQLAIQAGRACRPDITQRLLAPLLAGDDADLRDLVMRVLHAADDPRADIRLRIALLAAELQHEPADDDRLRIHHALADAYARLGDYHQALGHVQLELPLRVSLQGASHPITLATRANLAGWTGQAGDPVRARDLYAALLPVQQRVLGPEHPATLTTRADLAHWTGQAGDPAQARDLVAALLPVMERVLGPDHPDTLAIRNNLAGCTGQAGDPVRARDLVAALLPVVEVVLGPEHPATLTTRSHLARWTGEAGDPNAAKDLYAALVPVIERVLGPEHPDTLATRGKLVYWTRQAMGGEQ